MFYAVCLCVVAHLTLRLRFSTLWRFSAVFLTYNIKYKSLISMRISLSVLKPKLSNGSSTMEHLSCGLHRWTQPLYQLQAFHHHHSFYWGSALRKYPTHQPTRCRNRHKTFSLTFRWVLQEELSKQCGTKHRRTTAMNHKRGNKTTASIKARGRAAKWQHSAVWTDESMLSLYIEALFTVAAQQTKARTGSDRRALQQQFGSRGRPQQLIIFVFTTVCIFIKSPSVLHLLECRLISIPSLSCRPCPTLSSSLLQGIMCFWVCLVCSGGNFPWSVQMQRETGEQCGAVAARRGSKFLWRFKRGMLSATGGVPRSNHKSVYLVMVSQKDNSPNLCPITSNMITMMSSSLDCCAACRLNKLFPFTTKIANCMSRIPSRNTAAGSTSFERSHHNWRCVINQ